MNTLRDTESQRQNRIGDSIFYLNVNSRVGCIDIIIHLMAPEDTTMVNYGPLNSNG